MSTTSTTVAAEVRAELRSILRQRGDLRKPLGRFALVDSRPEGRPRHVVLFDQNPRLAVTGLWLAGCGELHLPDEQILDRVFEFAKSVWQLKDRLKLWAKAQGLSVDIEAQANKSQPLRVCADLANWKKHGENKNRSGMAPRIEVVTFDTSRSGALELYYNGATKHKELLVTSTIPIPYRVDIVANGGATQLGDAIILIERAFQDWLPTIQAIGVLSGGNRESEHLRKILFPPSP